jgi:signal transduction histidine kinase/CheY-like chemotaxis protein
VTATVDGPVSWDEQSRELSLTCDARGSILWLDARAARLLDTRLGEGLLSRIVPGAEPEALALLERGRTELVVGYELPMVAGSRPAMVSFCAKPGPSDTVHLLGLVVPGGHADSVRRLHEALGELMGLNRKMARQERQLEQSHCELDQAYRELDESKRGVVTLHAELADKADILRRASDVKSRVVAHVSHEFRTPLHTILGLSRLLLDASDAPLTDEQQKQVRFIRSSAEELSSLVNDLLDLSKAESGTAILRPVKFGATSFLAAIRGQLRPLLPTPSEVNLVFDEPPEDLELETDQAKVAQVVRNLVSNALKFTERGEVRVSMTRDAGTAFFSVKDTGIGIAADDYERVFEEFGQVEGPIQSRVKGTGLGLPLSRKLAELLGGTLELYSEVGKGSTFTLAIPASHPEVRELREIQARPLDPSKAPVLVVEDDRKTIFIYERYLSMAGFQVVPARSIEDARSLLQSVRPAAIVLDIMLDGEVSWGFLGQLKRDPNTKDIPVLVVTVTNKEQKARALGADEFWLKPVDQAQMLRKLRSISKPSRPARVLVIDDDHKARYLMRKCLEKSPYELLEAATGPDGITCARKERPSVIFLDFLLPDMTAFDVLDDLKADPRTRGIPVVIVTSHLLDAQQRERLAAETESILSKESLSRELAMNRIRDALQKAGVKARTRTETYES